MVLLDEIEKAHPDVFNVLLQVLDDGRLTDSQGRTVDFRNTVIIMTSNLGSHQIQELSTSGDYDGMKKAVMDIVGQHFRPEQIREIAKIQIEHLRQRLDDQDIAIELSEAALDKLGEAGFDPVYGARPLKRAIQQYLENPLAQQLLVGEYTAGDTIEVDVKDDELTFIKTQPMKVVV